MVDDDGMLGAHGPSSKDTLFYEVYFEHWTTRSARDQVCDKVKDKVKDKVRVELGRL